MTKRKHKAAEILNNEIPRPKNLTTPCNIGIDNRHIDRSKYIPLIDDHIGKKKIKHTLRSTINKTPSMFVEESEINENTVDFITPDIYKTYEYLYYLQWHDYKEGKKVKPSSIPYTATSFFKFMTGRNTLADYDKLIRQIFSQPEKFLDSHIDDFSFTSDQSEEFEEVVLPAIESIQEKLGFKIKSGSASSLKNLYGMKCEVVFKYGGSILFHYSPTDNKRGFRVFLRPSECNESELIRFIRNLISKITLEKFKAIFSEVSGTRLDTSTIVNFVPMCFLLFKYDQRNSNYRKYYGGDSSSPLQTQYYNTKDSNHHCIYMPPLKVLMHDKKLLSYVKNVYWHTKFEHRHIDPLKPLSMMPKKKSGFGHITIGRKKAYRKVKLYEIDILRHGFKHFRLFSPLIINELPRKMAKRILTNGLEQAIESFTEPEKKIINDLLADPKFHIDIDYAAIELIHQKKLQKLRRILMF